MVVRFHESTFSDKIHYDDRFHSHFYRERFKGSGVQEFKCSQALVPQHISDRDIGFGDGQNECGTTIFVRVDFY